MRLAFSEFYGLSERMVEGIGFHAKLMTADPNRIVARHSHDEPHVIIVLGGRYCSKAAPDRPLGSGDVVCNPAGVDHADTFGSGHGDFVAISLLASLYPALSDARAHAPFQANSLQARRGAARLLRCLKASIPDAAAAEEAIIELLDGEADLGRKRQKAAPGWLVEMHARILADPSAPLSVGALARAQGLSAAYVSRMFRACYGLPPVQLQMQRRIQCAAECLASSNQDVASIALDMGFCDQAHFTHSFSRYMRVPPAQYRAHFRSRRSN